MNQVIKVIAPAKVNLHLGIGALLDDGYHAATSVLHAITLHDTLTMRFADAEPGSGLSVVARCQGVAGVDAPEVESEDNIAHKAVEALARAVGREADEAVTIDIAKSIPHAAGLGGGSSDAAAALVGAARAWGIDPHSDQVVNVAASLGADVPFFLYGGCVCMTGRGDAFDHELEPMRKPLVLVRPDDGVSTAAAYKAFDEHGTPEASDAAAAVHKAKGATDVVLSNNLALASEQVLPELTRVREWLCGQAGVERGADGRPEVLLSGSGSASFAVCESMDAAYAIVSAAKLQGWWARSCSFAPIGASVLDVPGSRQTNLGAVHKSW